MADTGFQNLLCDNELTLKVGLQNALLTAGNFGCN